MLRHRYGILAAAVTGVLASAGLAAVDSVVTIVNATNATAGKAIAAFGYDPNNDAMYICSFGFTAPGANAVYRKIENVGGVQNSIPMMSEAQLQLYYRDGNPDRSVTSPTPSAMYLNPIQIGTGPTAIPAFSTAVVVDIATTRFPSSTTTDPAATKRFYRWNLQAPPAASPTPPPYGDGRDVITTIATFADMQLAAGTTNTSSNVGRQFAYSGDGQSIYALDISTAYGGVYKVDLVSNAISRISTFDDINTEPAVLTSGGVDSIFFGGGTVTSNVGGIDKITHDGTNTTARAVAISSATLGDFWELATNSGSILNMTADASGNLYFTQGASGTNRRGLYKYDTEGRLSKVVSYEERKVSSGLTTPNSNMLRPQARTTNFAGPSGTYPLTQILYAESSGANTVAGANVFEVGDFDRDNDADQTDIGMFKSALTLKGVALSATVAADHPKFRYDLNGNNEVSYKDVKILQQFYAFPDGDADINKTVDLDDFTVLAANFGLAAKRWTEGDFTGDETVNLDDFTVLAANFGVTSPADTASRSAVPEPAALGMLAAAAGMLLRRRK